MYIIFSPCYNNILCVSWQWCRFLFHLYIDDIFKDSELFLKIVHLIVEFHMIVQRIIVSWCKVCKLCELCFEWFSLLFKHTNMRSILIVRIIFDLNIPSCNYLLFRYWSLTGKQFGKTWLVANKLTLNEDRCRSRWFESDAVQFCWIDVLDDYVSFSIIKQ